MERLGLVGVEGALNLEGPASLPCRSASISVVVIMVSTATTLGMIDPDR